MPSKVQQPDMIQLDSESFSLALKVKHIWEAHQATYEHAMASAKGRIEDSSADAEKKTDELMKEILAAHGIEDDDKIWIVDLQYIDAGAAFLRRPSDEALAMREKIESKVVSH